MDIDVKQIQKLLNQYLTFSSYAILHNAMLNTTSKYYCMFFHIFFLFHGFSIFSFVPSLYFSTYK